MLQEILLPVYVIGGMGLFFGIILAFVSKKFEVQVDEKLASIREVLPGANCGACGWVGCDDFAQSLVDGRGKIDACPVGGQQVVRDISEIFGLVAGNIVPKTARVMCDGSYIKCKNKSKYSGISDCNAAISLFGGPSACYFGCMGLGSCVKECPFGAIVVEDGLARVIETECRACEKCVKICPKKIIRIVPKSSRYSVKCNSSDRGAIVRKNCSAGCIGCGKCAGVCKFGAIKLENNLAKIQTDLCTDCGECSKVCPTDSIKKYAVCDN